VGSSPPLAAAVGTVVASAGFWFAVAALPVAPAAALGIGATAAVLGLLAAAGLAGSRDPMTRGTRGVVLGLGSGAFLFLLGSVGGSFAVGLVPVAVLGVGGLVVLPSPADPASVGSRVVALGLVGILVLLLLAVDGTLWAFFAPLLPMPSLLLADRVAVRAFR